VPTGMCLARSTSAPCSRSRPKRRRRSPAELPIGCGRTA